MFYLTEIEDYVRVEPKLFGLPTEKAVTEQLVETYKEYYDKEIGQVISIVEIKEVGEGVIIPGDGASYYKSTFVLLAWKPEMQELVFGKVEEITNFGAFINLGKMKAMIHVSQTMNDFVSFSDTGSLSGKSSGRSLKQGDLCLARVVAISHKGNDPKIGLTMRQPGLGKLDWIHEDKVKAEAEAKKATKSAKLEKPEVKKGAKKK